MIITYRCPQKKILIKNKKCNKELHGIKLTTGNQQFKFDLGDVKKGNKACVERNMFNRGSEQSSFKFNEFLKWTIFTILK